MSRRGQVYPFIALMLVSMLGVSALSVDVGYYRYAQRVQQTAVDSAALAGAQAASFASPNAANAAFEDAALNGFATPANGGVTIAVDPNYSDSYTTGGTGVKVTITKTYPRFFGSLFSGGTQSISSSAVARLTGGGAAPDCLYSLGTSGSNFNGMTFNGAHCGIVDNGPSNFNGANINAGSVGYSGGAPNENGTCFGTRPSCSGPTPAPVGTATDPCANLSGCNYLKNNPPPTSPCSSGTLGSPAHPGCYNGPNENGAHVDFTPGLYVFTSSPNFNGATLTCSACDGLTQGVTFVLESGVSMNFNGVTATLEAPTQGDYAGMLFYSPNGSVNFNGVNAANLSGILYFPKQNMNLNGSVTFNGFGSIIADHVNFNGSTQTFGTPPPNNTITGSSKVVIAE